MIHSKIEALGYEKTGIYIVPFSTERQKILFYIGIIYQINKEGITHI